jgi:hypothetical protein
MSTSSSSNSGEPKTKEQMVEGIESKWANKFRRDSTIILRDAYETAAKNTKTTVLEIAQDFMKNVLPNIMKEGYKTFKLNMANMRELQERNMQQSRAAARTAQKAAMQTYGNVNSNPNVGNQLPLNAAVPTNATATAVPTDVNASTAVTPTSAPGASSDSEDDYMDASELDINSNVGNAATTAAEQTNFASNNPENPNATRGGSRHKRSKKQTKRNNNKRRNSNKNANKGTTRSKKSTKRGGGKRLSINKLRNRKNSKKQSRN